MLGKNGGYYVYTLLEDSAQFVDQVKVRQKYFQGQLALEDFVGPFRLEVGTQYQHSQTNGQSLTRVTQDVVDSGRYLAGTPLVNLDANADGRIGFLEMHQRSPVLGNIGAANQPLVQRWAWPTDPDGNRYPLGEFPTVAGIPVTMLNYLNENPQINCRAAEVMRSMTAGSPLPVSGQLPVGFVLDPCTVAYRQVSFRANPSFEKDQNGKLLLAYVDLIYDVNPDFTIKNQLFFDGMDQHKNGEQPFNEYQNIYAVENKFTVTRRIPSEMLPSWARINSLASANIRLNYMDRKVSFGDYYSRNDATLNMGAYTANTAFWTPGDDPSYSNGYPFAAQNTTQFVEGGLGLMFDIDLFTKTNIVIGGRYDRSDARNTDYGGTLNTQTGTSANPGAYRASDVTARGSDTGASYSVSLSHQLPYGFRPYATYALSSLVLAGSSNQVGNSVIANGHIGEAELQEAGLKLSLLQDRLFLTGAYYEQTRNDVTEPNDPGFGAEVSSTVTTGVELEAKWQVTPNLFIAGYALFQESKYLDLPITANVSINGSSLGFQDVVDPLTGELLYPADAFLWGGRASLMMPADLSAQYRTRQGDPEEQFGLNGMYKLGHGFGFTFSSNYFSKTYSDRLQQIELPEVVLLNAGVTWDRGRVHLKFDVFNINNEKYLQAPSGDNVGDRFIAQPDRQWQLTARLDF
jgi:outer membrane receptor protein involved in Fe transport